MPRSIKSPKKNYFSEKYPKQGRDHIKPLPQIGYILYEVEFVILL